MRWLVWILLFPATLHAEPFGKPRTKVLGARTQLEFDDQTIIRLGAKTDFEFIPGSREVLLGNGTMLFSSPKGAGGGLIHTRTVVVTLTEGDLQMSRINDQVKVICLTGKVHVASTGNLKARDSLRPGEMVVIPAGAMKIPATTIVNMPLMIQTSGLMSMGPLPSQATIEKNARKQKGVQPAAPPRAESEAIVGNAMATIQIENQQSLIAQQLAQQQAAIAAAEEAARQQQIAATQRRVAAEQQAAELERTRAQTQQPANQGNQGNAFGPQGNQGVGPGGNRGQGNQGNQGNKPPAPPGQNK